MFQKKILLPITFILLPFCCFSAVDIRDRMVPTPRYCQSEGEALFVNQSFHFENTAAVPQFLLEWLETGFHRVLGWKNTGVATNGNGLPVVFTKLKADSNFPKEYYELDIRKNEITLKAAEPAGFCRAAGRLMGIIESPLIRNNQGGAGYLFPLVTLRDAPSSAIPIRAFMLHIEGSSSPLPDMQSWRANFYRHIDVAAMLGYNAMFINFGGRMELKNHPECVLRNFRSHSQEEIRRLIEYAKGLGMQVWPMTSAMGHFSSGYQIFPISQEKVPNINGVIVTAKAMNLGHPDFYRVFFEVMDEVCDVFNNPEYLVIRTDEFFSEIKLLEKYTKQPFLQYYSEFMNRCARHMAKRGTKIVIFQDMWIPAHTPDEESNGGPDAEKLMKLVDKNVSICYWSYNFRSFSWLDKFKENGFNDLWVMPWFMPEPTRRLIAKGRKNGAKVFAGVWSEPGQNNGLPAIAEYAWNPDARPYQVSKLNDFSDFFFYSRETKIQARTPATVKPEGGIPVSAAELANICRNDSGIPVDFSGARMFQGKPDWMKLDKMPNLLKLHEEENLKDISFGVKGCPQRIGFLRPGVDQIRGNNELVIYTPEWGESTRTNMWGHEFSIVGDTVKTVDLRFMSPASLQTMGNHPIWKDALTLSRHGINFYDDGRHAYRNSNTLLENIKPGTKLEFFRKVKGEKASGKITFALSGKRKKVVLYLWATGCLTANTQVASVTLKTADGKSRNYSVNGNQCYISGYNHLDETHRYLPWIEKLHNAGLPPVIAVESVSGTAPFVSLEVTPTQHTANAGIVVLGATEHENVGEGNIKR